MSESDNPAYYTYVLVRADIPLADQIVQVGHVCLEAGRQLPWPAAPTHLVVLCVPSERHLHEAIAQIAFIGIRYSVFHEPDDAMHDTAVCTEPMTRNWRRLFRRFPLWGRGPPRELVCLR